MKFNLKDFFLKNKEISQLIYGVLLIVLIIALISFNSFSIIKKYRLGLNDSLNHQAYFYAKSIYTLIKDELGDTPAMQKSIDSLMDKNSEIKEFTILSPEKNSFKVIASTDRDKIDLVTNFYLYKFAWQQDDYQGVATDSISMSLTQTEEDRVFAQELIKSGRNWFVALPMYNSFGEKEAVFSVMISADFENKITKDNQLSSLIITLATIVIVILFLSLTLRLWDYALLYKKAKEVDEMKDEFISMASHELRTPVTGIKGYASMILDGSFGDINDKIKNGVGIINTAAGRLAVLVEDLLNVSRIEQGRMSIETKPIDIHDTIADVVKELKVQSDSKNLALNYLPFSRTFPKVEVDVNKIKQILINIIGNSIKYTEQGKIDVLVEEKDKKLVIKIKDTGIGMTAEARQRLFQKFYRIQSEKTKNITGTGLGLWITKQLVELMKGSIAVESMEGVGSQFTLKFPIV